MKKFSIIQLSLTLFKFEVLKPKDLLSMINVRVSSILPSR